MTQTSPQSSPMAGHAKAPASGTNAEHHTKAAECCQKAAEEHRHAAKCSTTGDHLKATEHGKQAQEHCTKAAEHSKHAMAA